MGEERKAGLGHSTKGRGAGRRENGGSSCINIHCVGQNPAAAAAVSVEASADLLQPPGSLLARFRPGAASGERCPRMLTVANPSCFPHSAMQKLILKKRLVLHASTELFSDPRAQTLVTYGPGRSSSDQTPQDAAVDHPLPFPSWLKAAC